MNWCSWKPNILFCGSSFPRPSICAHSKRTFLLFNHTPLSDFASADLYFQMIWSSDTATGVLVGDFECASEVSGIQFNDQLKQVATSHHSCLIHPDAAESRVVHSFGAIKLLKKRMMYTIFFRQIHGAESTVQLWQLTSNKLNPVMELLRKTWTTFDIFIVNWVFDHFHPLVVFYFLEYYQSTKKGSSAWLHLSIIVNCSPWAAMSCCVYGTGTIPPLIQIQIRRGSRSLVVNWMRSTLSASPTFYKQIFSFFQILKFQSCLLNTWFYKDILLYQKYTEVVT